MLSLNKISKADHPNAAIVLRWLGAIGEPHPDLVNFLEKQSLEVHFFDREGDSLLQEPRAIEAYCQKIKEEVKFLTRSGKYAHLIGISFWAFLSMKVAQEIKTVVKSVVALAPLIDPYAILAPYTKAGADNLSYTKLMNGLSLPVLQENMESMKYWRPENIVPPTIVILGENDGIETVSKLGNITGNSVSKHVLPDAQHGETTGHPRTHALLEQFYGRLFHKAWRSSMDQFLQKNINQFNLPNDLAN